MTAGRKCMLSENIADNVPMDVRQAKISTLESVGQSSVIET
jgi:hypothetical protein